MQKGRWFFVGKNELASFANSSLLQKPGDKVEAYVTKTGRKVIKARTDNGAKKQSATMYQSGKVHLTQTIDLTKWRGKFLFYYLSPNLRSGISFSVENVGLRKYLLPGPFLIEVVSQRHGVWLHAAVLFSCPKLPHPFSVLLGGCGNSLPLGGHEPAGQGFLGIP